MDYKMDKSMIKKKEIVDIIVNLMDEDGLKNITIKDICESANISIGSFYHYFESKDSIVKEMYKLMDEYFLVNKNSIMAHTNVADQIIDYVNHFGLYAEQWGYYANLLIMRSAMSNSSNYPDRKIYEILNDIIQPAIKDKKFQVDIDTQELFSMIFVIIRGHFLEWIKNGENYPVRENMVKQVTYLMNYIT